MIFGFDIGLESASLSLFLNMADVVRRDFSPLCLSD